MSIVEKWSLTDDQRTDWTAAVVVLRAEMGDDPRFAGATKKKPGGGISITRGKPLPKQVPAKGDGPVFLGHELAKKGVKAPTWDTVYWQTSPGKYKQIGRDWGDWKKRIRGYLDTYGIADPRADENARAWGIALGIAGAAVAGALVVTGVGAAAAPYVLSATTSAAGALYASADEAELAFAGNVKESTGEDYRVTGSSKAQAIGAAGAGLANTITAQVGEGAVNYDALASQAANLYGAITAPGTAPAAAAAPATPAPPAETTAEKVVAFVKTPAGVAVVLVAAFLVFRAVKRG
jgi:hypothetical protein